MRGFAIVVDSRSTRYIRRQRGQNSIVKIVKHVDVCVSERVGKRGREISRGRPVQ